MTPASLFARLLEVQAEINQLARELQLLWLAMARRGTAEQDCTTVRALQSRLVKLYRTKRVTLAALSAGHPSDAESLWSVEERAIWTLARLLTPNGHEKGRAACSYLHEKASA
jgi:hypothetical protein